MVDGGIDKVESVQVAVIGQEGIRLVQAGPAAQGAQQWPGQPGATAAEPVRIAFDDLLFQRAHGRGKAWRRGFAAQPAPGRRQPGFRFLAVR